MSTPHRASSAMRTRVHACARALLLLAAGVVFVRVLASEPVYAKAPPPSATTETPAKTPPQRPKASASTTTPAPTPRSTPPAADTSTKSETKSETKSAAKPDSKPDSKSSAKSSTKASAKTKPGAARGKSSKTRIEEEFLIEGKLEKPSAYYILRRSEVDFDWARLGATFSPLVLESVQDPLF